MAGTKKKRPTVKLTEEQKKERNKKRRDAAFRRKIRMTLTNAGFQYFPTTDKHFSIGHRKVELDYLFVYDNVILICEDTCSKKKDKDHIRKKSEAFREIQANIPVLLDWMKEELPGAGEIVDEYPISRLRVFYIYIPQVELNLTDDEKKLYSNLLFWEPETLSYFYKMSQCIYHSARYEIFRFLELKNENIGPSGSGGSKETIKAPIICSEESMGHRNGIRVVSFMMSADILLRTSYVLRKDNWENSMFLYQRLIEKEKVKGIRKFLASKKETFYNNVIVALPDNVRFQGENDQEVSIGELGDFQHCKMIIPDEMNSICVIDGQHRIFAHYEAPENEKYEKDIAKLRKRLHLLVTGLVFPADMPNAERKRIQSEIFLDINDNTKKVASNVLMHIEMLKDPFSDIGLARRVVEKLNGERTFLKRFELSSLDESKIKVASIVKFALRYLVTIKPSEGKKSLYEFWDGDKEAFLQHDETALKAYIEFCAKKLDMFFSAIKNTYSDQWGAPDSKLLSVTAMNGFIIAYNRQLAKNGIQDFAFYRECFEKMDMDFSKDNFPYTSSQYRKFSNEVLQRAFGFTEEELGEY